VGQDGVMKSANLTGPVHRPRGDITGELATGVPARGGFRS